MLAGRAIHDVVERATRHQPELKSAMAKAECLAPRIKEVINEVTSAMAARAVPRNAVTEEFERKFPTIFRAAVVQGAHVPKPGMVDRGAPLAGKAAKGALASMAEKALFIAALEGAIDEAEQSQNFGLASAIGQLTVKLDRLRPEYREDLQELNQMLDMLQQVTQASHQTNMGAVQNLRR